MRTALPIDEHLAALVDTIRVRGAAVVAAAPGTGKTTRLPPALVDAGVEGEVVVLEPRRVAARAAARRVAAERGGRVGAEVGYQVRHERIASPATRLRYVTEGVLVRQLTRDPFLEGVGAVVLDEFHERHLEGDLALGMLAEARATVRPDLLVVVMSATLETAPIAAFLGDCPVVEVPVRSHEVRTEYDARPSQRALAERVAAAVRRALDETERDVLVFLPGVGEIRAAARALAERRLSVEVLELHGSLDAKAQDAALQPGTTRRVVLSTNLAESSVTLPGVGAVIDTGLVRRLQHDPTRGLDVLRLQPISMASADQRRGRAGRLGPGVCYRLWTEAEHRARAAVEPPEVRRLDVCGAVLQLRAFSAVPAARFGWFEAPAAGALAAAEDLLRGLGAIEEDGDQLTATGRRMLDRPLHPRLARAMLEAERLGCAAQAALPVALLAEREVVLRDAAPGSHPLDLLELADLVRTVAQPRVDRRRCAANGLDGGAVHEVVRVARRLHRDALAPPDRADAEQRVAQALLTAYPDRVCCIIGPAEAVMVGGRGVRLPDDGAGSKGELFLAVAVADPGNRRATRSAVTRTVHVDRAMLRRVWPDALEQQVEAVLDEDAARVVGVRRLRFRDLVVEEARGGAVDAATAAELLGDLLERDPWRYLQPRARIDALCARVAWLRAARPELELPDLDDAAVVAAARTVLIGTRLADLRTDAVVDALRAGLGPAQGRLRQLAPARLLLPSGRQANIDYGAPAGPTVRCAVQEMFGQRETPTVAGGRVPVVLELLLPSQRPVQVTRDLASFWDNVYPGVRVEMRRRYPRHAWPENPLRARPHRGPERRHR